MPSIALIQKRIEEIIKMIKRLERLLKESNFTNEDDLYLAERLMERLITSAIDINQHLLADLTETVANTYKESFIKLSNLNILNRDLAEKLSKSAGLRNLLTHEYLDLDKSIFIESCKTGVEDYKDYLKSLQAFISNSPE